MRKKLRPLSFALAGMLVLSAASAAFAPFADAADKTTKYRVYQNDRLLQEFSDRKQAETYARGYAHSHVEEIGTRKWLWDNFPRYVVYQLDKSLPEWEFANVNDAIAEAGKWSYASVRDLQKPGWIWNNYPRYRVYQGDNTLDSWTFATLAEATAEAKRWAGAHIIDLADNRWIWDNLSAADKAAARSGPANYRVYQGTYSAPEWNFAYLEDAINEALRWGGSTVVNRSNRDAVVFENAKPYDVYQNDNRLDAFTSLDQAIAYAAYYAHTTVRLQGRPIWTNTPTYSVLQGTNPIGEFPTLPQALAYAVQYSNASIRTPRDGSIWNNIRSLLYWGWNGSSAAATVKQQASITKGLDMDSPSWFLLDNADGGLKDNANKESVDWLHSQNIAVHPLVGNQFSGPLTTAFLINTDAQMKFIRALVDRCVALGVDGFNIDFESVAGSDRNNFTAFMKRLTDDAHAHGLIVSIDLPRGSVRWNHLSAFDHEKLAPMVDYVMTMAYDQYWSGSTSPGSVAGLQWIEEGVQEFLAYGIPREKLMLGIPFYVRDWTLDDAGKPVSNKALYMKDLPALIKSRGATATWDPSFNQYKIEYSEDGKRHVFWLENVDTVKARLDVAKKYELAGVAAWRLGYDSADLWNMMIGEK